MWIGPSSNPIARIRRRIGRLADGWFVLCTPEEFPAVQADIHREAEAAGRNPHAIGTEAGVAVVGPREAEWRERVSGWRGAGLSHLCLRTLGGGLDAQGHLDKMQQAYTELPTD
jgi:alkanesulfonate monooxygenase SsuD/methylene tetrahydromethanopterin reductase-like flavin-dependent oxidoreductase (luciferase family)